VVKCHSLASLAAWAFLAELRTSYKRKTLLRPLTVNQAQAEARWRWGGLFVRGFARHAGSRRLPFEVGTSLFGSVTIRGQGNSWEAAFSNADALTNGKKRKD